MEGYSMHGFSFFRYFTTKVLIVSVFFNIYFYNVSCANIREEDTSSIEDKGNNSTTKENEQDTLSHRQLPLQIANPNGNYLNAPTSFGFPFYQRPGYQNGPTFTLQDQAQMPGAYLPAKQSATKELSNGGGTLKDSSITNNDSDIAQQTTKKPRVKAKKKKPVVEMENEIQEEKLEAKTDDGTERNCPGCVGGTCDPTLSPNTNISGIPVIQIIIGLFAGVFWAMIFLFIFKNFIERQPEEPGGYAPSPSPQYGTPQYGAPPQSHYGAPAAAAPAAGYSTNRISYDTYAQPYGRSLGGSSFSDVSRWVWNAIEKVANVYEE